MTVDLDQGTAWIVGAVAAVPILRQAVALAKDLRGKDRSPPLAEEVAGRYATRAELSGCRARCDADIALIRVAIGENDRKAEERAHDTHRRIDAVYTSLGETNRKLGVIIGAMLARGRLPNSVLTDETQTGG